jgi:hypothetical protein
MAESLPTAGDAGSLAGEAAGDEIDGLDPGSDVAYVSVNRDSWEPLLEDSRTELILLAKPAMLEPGQMEAVGEQADPVEQSSYRHAASPS